MVARFTSTLQQSYLCQYSTLICKVHLPFLSQPSHFFHQPAFTTSSSASLSSFHLQPQNLIPFSRHDHIMTYHIMTIPINTVCYSQLIYGFTHTQHKHQICIYFLSLSCTPHIALTMDLCPSYNFHLTFLQSACFTSIQYCWTYITLINSPFSIGGNRLPYCNSLHYQLSPLTSCSCNDNSLTTSSSIHPVTNICEFHYNSNLIT